MRNFATSSALFVNTRAADGLHVQSWRKTVTGGLVRSAQAVRVDVNDAACDPAHPHTPMTPPVSAQKLTEAACVHRGFRALTAHSNGEAATHVLPGRILRAHASADRRSLQWPAAPPLRPPEDPLRSQHLRQPRRPHRAAPPHTPLTLTRSRWEEQ